MQSSVRIRDYHPADKPFVLQLINEGFNVDSRFRSHQDTFLDLYLHTAVLRATHFRIALIDDKPVGLLIGRIQGDPVLPGARGKLAAIVGNFFRLLPVFPRERTGLKDWASEQLVAWRLMRRITARNIPVGNEVVLFVVSSQCRGTGVGKALFGEFSEQAEEFFLYTDSHCTWQFYEKRGMRRVAEIQRTSPLYSEPVDHYIYVF
ncbi:GNAT family N-acetyltransferase [Corynebacterium cystitidis]|uniref:GNAT family N-acetyltransferase n=1 Tax=Corynebacterium cystitidis TaxID=35757 RepID=UPI00211F0B2B|nr:GNAT family N-acetyltransferase [Corynebacterium cystitidis]